jgi:myo-inositol-1(or 4)-monophosphatase
METLQQLTLSVCDVARRAGQFIRQEREKFQSESIERKHAHDYVSYVDKQSEQLIITALRELLPEAGFVTEEGQAGYADEEYCWFVDPLDGTTNFLHRFAPYAVSIGLLRGSEIQIGVVYEICADECFYAWQGGGAWLQKAGDAPQVLHVSTQGLTDALVCLQLPYNSDAYNPIVRQLLERLYGRVASVRMLGSAAMALCYVAAGRLDAYVEKYIGRWDYMAGALLVMEAGGCVTTYNGSSDFTRGDDVVATNGIVHQTMVDEVGLALQKAVK